MGAEAQSVYSSSPALGEYTCSAKICELPCLYLLKVHETEVSRCGVGTFKDVYYLHAVRSRQSTKRHFRARYADPEYRFSPRRVQQLSPAGGYDEDSFRIECTMCKTVPIISPLGHNT